MLAQDADGTYERALAELRAGRKVSHWMWFVFPQVAGLGRSATSRKYAIGIAGAKPGRISIIRCSARVCGSAPTCWRSCRAPSAEEIFGAVDAQKLRSSMTLFMRARPAEGLFGELIERYFDGAARPATDGLLAAPILQAETGAPGRRGSRPRGSALGMCLSAQVSAPVGFSAVASLNHGDGSRPERTSRTHLWLEGLGDWSWPGGGGSGDEFLPPSWVPALPPRLEPAVALAGAGAGAWAAWRPGAPRGRLWLFLGLLGLAALGRRGARWPCPASANASACGAESGGSRGAAASRRRRRRSRRCPRSAPIHTDAGGSVVEQARFALGFARRPGSFFAYLPAGYAAAAQRYPVLYLLHGRNGHAEAFLEMGIQASLDGLIARHVIAPMIVVMLQDAPGPAATGGTSALATAPPTWWKSRNSSTACSGRSRTRAARAIAGSSMGGFGAMNVALSNPLRFAVVESWLGFFDHLARRPRRGPTGDLAARDCTPSSTVPRKTRVAVPTEDPEFAAELRAAGAQRARASSTPGGHSLEKVRAHLDYGLLFAGRSLVAAQHRADAEAARPAHLARAGSRTEK